MLNVEDYSMIANSKSPVLPACEGNHLIGKRCRIASILLDLGNDTLSIPRCQTPNILDSPGRPFDLQLPPHTLIFAKSESGVKEIETQALSQSRKFWFKAVIGIFRA